MCAVVYLFWGGYAKIQNKQVSMYFWHGSGGSLTRMKNITIWSPMATFLHCSCFLQGHMPKSFTVFFCAVTNTVVDRSGEKKNYWDDTKPLRINKKRETHPVALYPSMLS